MAFWGGQLLFAYCMFYSSRVPLAYDLPANSRVHYYPPLSSTSFSWSRMYLIILLSVTLWCLFGGCYLFVVETPLGSIQPIRDCCSVNSPLTSSGWAWLLFKWVSFVLALSSNLRVTDSQGGRFNAIAVRSAPRRVVTPEPSEPEGGCRASRSRGNKTLGRCLRKDALLSRAERSKWAW